MTPYLRYQIVYRVPQPGGGDPIETLNSGSFDDEDEVNREVERQIANGWDCYAISYTVLHRRPAQALSQS